MKITRIEGYNGKYGSNPQGIREFFMIASNLIESDDESMIEIGKMVFYERGLEDDST